MKNLADLVRLGGFLVFTDKFPIDGIYQKEPHVRRRSLKMYHDILTQQGFIIERVEPVFMDDPIVCGYPRWLGVVSYMQ